jgi:glycosyltransferase involved in cell wall biosynthesis
MAEIRVSLCMIVRNEERVLAQCLDSVRDVADELIVVDTGSTDSSIAIAAKYGASVYPFDFTRTDFAAARNHGLEIARGRWILALDADESLHAESVPLIRGFVSRDDNAGYYFTRLNRDPNSPQARTDYVVRLFPNRPGYRYRGRVHETIDAAILAGGGRLLRTEIRIDHDFAPDPEARRQRNLRYIEILNEEIAADPADHSRLSFLAAEYHQLGMFAQAAEVAERIAQLRPLDAEAHLHVGVYHLLYKIDRRRARLDLMEALRLKPDYPEAKSFLEMLDEKEKAD